MFAAFQVQTPNQAESSKAKTVGVMLGSSGFCYSFSFFLILLEKQLFTPLLIAR